MNNADAKIIKHWNETDWLGYIAATWWSVSHEINEVNGQQPRGVKTVNAEGHDWQASSIFATRSDT